MLVKFTTPTRPVCPQPHIHLKGINMQDILKLKVISRSQKCAIPDLSFRAPLSIQFPE